MLLAGDILFPKSWYAPYYVFGIIQILLLSSHLSLLDRTRRGVLTRVVLLLPTLYLTLDLAFNPRYSLGARLRDLALGTIGWYLTAKALDVGLVYALEVVPPPRWCVPDWVQEAKKEDGIPADDAVGNERQLPFWKRTPVPKRPKWAIKSSYLPTHWKLLPLPTRFVDQLIWAIDVYLLRRPGTSLLFPGEMRALEWSQKRLEKAARARKEEGKWRVKTRLDPSVSPFGYSETSLSDAVLQAIVVIIAVYYISGLDISASHPGGFYGLPMHQQLSITACMGILVSFPGDLPELFAFPLLQQWPLDLPCTAITPHFRNVVRSKSLTDLWGFQWHGFIRREVTRLGFLFPVAKNNRVMILLKSFFWSAVFHSFIFVRVRPDIILSSPWTLLRSFYFPGSFALFMGQGVAVISENVFVSLTSKSRPIKAIKASPLLSTISSYLQSLYVYGSLIWMARWLVAEFVPLHLLTHQELYAMNVANQWTDYSFFWRERWNDLFF